MEGRRVFVTGIGVVSPIGKDFAEFSKNLLDGKCGGGDITLFDASSFPVKIAAEVKDLRLSDFTGYEDMLEVTRFRDRKTELAFAAAEGAVKMAGIEEVEPPEHPDYPHPLPPGLTSRRGCTAGGKGGWKGGGSRFRTGFRFGISWGTGLSSTLPEEIEEDLLPLLNDDGEFDFSKERVRKVMENEDPLSPWRHLVDMAPAIMARRFGFRGPAFTSFSSCSASAQAIGLALRVIRRGEADIMLAGGADSMIHPFGLLSFALLDTLSKGIDPAAAMKPFDRERDGFLLGEGAVFFVLEGEDAARRRGVEPLAEIAGYGSSADVESLTAPSRDGRGGALCMEKGLQDAGIGPEEVDYINAHGTATRLNDPVETLAIKKVFGGAARRIPVSSSKPQFGHLIAAAGAIELAAVIAAMRGGILPPNLNLITPDPECDLNYVTEIGKRAEIRTALSTSFGFGGFNAALVVKRVEG